LKILQNNAFETILARCNYNRA